MPELPEVENVRRSLLPLVVNRRLGAVRVPDGHLRFPVDTPALRRALPGRRILDIRRRGKYLLFDVEGNRALLVHLGMTGRLAVVPSRRRRETHDRVLLSLEGGEQLRFNDARRFGVVELVSRAEEDEHRLLHHLGVEPLGPAFAAGKLRRAARGRRIPIKSFLMDARQIVGVGNIYASEACFAAGIHPNRPAGGLSPQRWERLAASVRAILGEAITLGGTSFSTFVNAEGSAGRYRRRLMVYGREGEACRRCERTVRRVVHSGRSTFYCPGCQH
jgi:formamidopyrimidine-DNA glycosylase